MTKELTQARIKALQDVNILCNVLYEQQEDLGYRSALLDVKKTLHALISDELVNVLPAQEAYSYKRHKNIIIEVTKDDKSRSY